MCGSGDGRHIVHSARAVVHMRKHQHRCLRPQRGQYIVRLYQLQAATMALAQALGNIQISRKVAALADDDAPRRVRVLRNADGRCQNLEQIYRGRVRCHHLVGPGADQGGDACAQALRQVKPTRSVPGPNQPLAPFLLHHLRGAGCGGHRQYAERIAVQVNRLWRNTEMGAQGTQWVGRVEPAAVVQSGHGNNWLELTF